MCTCASPVDAKNCAMHENACVHNVINVFVH